MARFTKTISIGNELELKGLQPGQWVRYTGGISGQYLGQTKAGTYVIRWGEFSKRNAMHNKLQRSFALRYGSK